MKTFFVENLPLNERIQDVFLVAEKKVGHSSSNGAPYVHLILKDRTGSIKAVKWDADLRAFGDINPGDYVVVEGTVTTYKETLQIRLDFCRKYTGEIDHGDFVPRSAKNVDEMLASVMEFVESVKHPQLKQLLSHFFGDSAWLDRFKAAPAALRVHHAYVGGLIEHTLAVARLCSVVSTHYPEVNRDLLVAGSLLHDIGKLEEISWEKSIDYTDAGHFVGHVVAGAMAVESAISSIPGFDHALRMEFLHLMLSHHGKREFGAPVLPGTREAIVLHYLEDMDAKLKMFEDAVAAGGNGRWTSYHSRFERHLFRGPQDMEKPMVEEPLIQQEMEQSDPFADE